MTMRTLWHKLLRYSCWVVCLCVLTISHADYKTFDNTPLPAALVQGSPPVDVIKEQEMHGNITLDFKKIPVRELVQFIADAMHYNVIMSENVSGNLSLHFHNMTWQQALDAILEMSGLVKKQKDNLLFIGTANEFATKQKNLSDAAPLKIITVKLRHVDANVLSTLLRATPEILSSMAKINCNLQDNSLWIREKMANIPVLLDFIAALDKPEKQILVTAKIVNVDDRKTHELGIHFNVANKHSGNELNFSLPQTVANSLSVAIASYAQNQLLNLQIEALESTGHSKLIANPRIITQNRKAAIIEAGEEIPYPESTAHGATSVSFKKAALSLQVTPTLLPDGRIILALAISQNKTSPLAVNGTPAIQTQELKTEVVVHDNQTVILGGIFETACIQVHEQLPVISKIPVLGYLLSKREKQVMRKELLIFVSPHVLEDNRAF
jgi:type IV pilus assembly protein PilQ